MFSKCLGGLRLLLQSQMTSEIEARESQQREAWREKSNDVLTTMEQSR